MDSTTNNPRVSFHVGGTMEGTRRTATAFGIFMIAAIVCGVLSSVPAIEAPDYLERLETSASRILVAVFFQAAMATLYVAIAVVMYPIVKLYSRSGALAYLTFRSVGAAFLYAGIVTLLLLLALGRLHGQADTARVENLALIGALVRQARDWLNHIGMILPWSIGGVFLYVAFFRTKLIPWWISIWGLLATASTLLATMLYMFDQLEIVSVSYLAMNLPTALFEITLALYLIVRGFRKEQMEGLSVRE